MTTQRNINSQRPPSEVATSRANALKIVNVPQSAPAGPFSKQPFYYHAVGFDVRPKLAKESLIVDRAFGLCLPETLEPAPSFGGTSNGPGSFWDTYS